MPLVLQSADAVNAHNERRCLMVSLIAANMRKLFMLACLAGFVIGFHRGLNLTEEQKRRIKKALFEVNELPRRIFI